MSLLTATTCWVINSAQASFDEEAPDAPGRFQTEEIIQKLREAEVLLSVGKGVTAACRQTGMTDNTDYRWRKEYGGVRTVVLGRLVIRSDL